MAAPLLRSAVYPPISGDVGPLRRLPFALAILGLFIPLGQEVEDVDPQRPRGRRQLLEPLGADHGNDGLAMGLSPLARISDDRPVGRPQRCLPDWANSRIDVRADSGPRLISATDGGACLRHGRNGPRRECRALRRGCGPRARFGRHQLDDDRSSERCGHRWCLSMPNKSAPLALTSFGLMSRCRGHVLNR